jgi:tRNA threonylcarbamoyladenosine biosynthesis protein TsaE
MLSGTEGPQAFLAAFRLAFAESRDGSAVIEEYVEGDGVTVIEWADRIAGVLPAKLLRVEITFGDGDERGILFQPRGKRFENIVRRITAK